MVGFTLLEVYLTELHNKAVDLTIKDIVKLCGTVAVFVHFVLESVVKVRRKPEGG